MSTDSQHGTNFLIERQQAFRSLTSPAVDLNKRFVLKQNEAIAIALQNSRSLLEALNHPIQVFPQSQI